MNLTSTEAAIYVSLGLLLEAHKSTVDRIGSPDFDYKKSYDVWKLRELSNKLVALVESESEQEVTTQYIPIIYKQCICGESLGDRIFYLPDSCGSCKGKYTLVLTAPTEAVTFKSVAYEFVAKLSGKRPSTNMVDRLLGKYIEDKTREVRDE